MTLTTRSFRWPIASRFLRLMRGAGAEPARSRRSGDINPPVASIARPVATALRDTRLGEVAEMLRMSPYSEVPVVSGADGELLGRVTETALSNLLLAANDEAARASVRELTVAALIEPTPGYVTLFQRARDVAILMDEFRVDTLPVLDHNRQFLGMVSRSDLVHELLRPFRPPTVGGMATPNGVYLTTGLVSGGATAASLVLAGLLMFLLQHLPLIATYPLSQWMTRATSHSALLQAMTGDLVPSLVSVALFFVAVRLSPIAGFHAAEHQVVHAIERSEPLLIANVRAMPRVHPRCGTNLVAGVMICTLIGGALQPLFHWFAPSLDEIYLGFVLGGIIAFAYWRSVGSYLQQNWTTRPATDAQIEAGIRAANELLVRHGDAHLMPQRPIVRLWRMGLLQMVLGFIIGYALLLLVSRVFPGLGAWIKPILLS